MIKKILILLIVTVFATVVYGGACENITNGLIHAWNMEEASGSQTDKVGSLDFDVISDDPIESQEGINNNAVFFNGNDRYVSDASVTWTGGSYTWCAWLLINNTGWNIISGDDRAGGDHVHDWLWRRMTLATYAQKWSFWSVSDGGSSLDHRTNAGGIDNQWTLNCIQFGTEGRKLVINGTEFLSEGGIFYPYNTTLYLGGDAFPDGFFNGGIDEVTIWERQLNSDELSGCLWNSGSGFFYPFDVNNVPTVSNVTVSNILHKDSVVNCSYTVNDVDGDDVNVSIGWYINGVADDHYNATSLNVTQGVNVTTGIINGSFLGYKNTTNNIACKVVATDGSLTSTAANSNNGTVFNRIPTAVLISLTETILHANDSVHCSATALEYDSQDIFNITLLWEYNSAVDRVYNTTFVNITNNTFYNTSIGNGSYTGSTIEGDTFSCLVNVTDGENYSSHIGGEFVTVDVFDIILEDIHGSYITSLDETDIFFIGANWTVAGTENGNADCNFTASNISAHFSINSTQNITLNDSNSVVNLSINENNDTALNDLINFKICRIGDIKIPAQVLINGVEIYEIDKNIIPLCSIGSHEETNISTVTLSDTIINLSVTCDTCDNNNRILQIVTDLNETLHFERKFRIHNESMVYNTEKKIYQFSNHYYHFADQGQQYINETCNQSLSQWGFNVENVNLIVNILSIDDVVYTDGMQVESNETNNIIIDVSGDIINYIDFNITYNNGTFIKGTGEENLTVNSVDLPLDAIYNISIVAVDDDGNITVKSGYFYVNDTVSPGIIWNNPTNDNASTFTVSIANTVDIAFTDVNLFAYEFLILDPSNDIKVNRTLTGINASTENLVFALTPNVTGTWKANATVTDDHTAASISDYPYTINEGKNLYFTFEKYLGKQYVGQKNLSIVYMSGHSVDDVVLIKGEDRYSMKYTFNSIDTKAAKITHQYRIECEDLYYRWASNYTAHFVCYSTKNWLDFESPDIIEYEIKSCGRDCYDVYLEMKPADTVEFSSLGGLNEIQEVVSFTVAAAAVAAGDTNTTWVTNECPGSTPAMLGFIGIAFLLVIFMGIALMAKSGLLGFFSSIGLMAVAWTIAGCSHLIYIVMAAISIFMMLWFGGRIWLGWQ